MVFYVLLGAIAIFGTYSVAQTKSEGAIMKNWNRWDDLFKKYGTLYNIPWQWGKAIALNESSLGNEKSVALGLIEPDNVEGSKSYDGKSWGLMQVTLTTAKELDPLATVKKLNDPEYSIKLGMKYLSMMRAKYPATDSRSIEWTIKSYNQGPGNTAKEKMGSIKGYAQTYWERFQRNLKKVEEN